MAELILTDKEKADASYLDWDDLSLGRACRKAMTEVRRATEDSEKWVFYTQACASMLVSRAIEVNAATSTYGLDGFFIKDVYHGDWEVIVRQKMNPVKRFFKWCRSLFSKIEKLTITSQTDENGKSKVVQVDWKNRKVKDE